MQVKTTYIVKNEGWYIIMYETFDGKYFRHSHLVGKYIEIKEEVAIKLIKDSK